MKLSKIKPNPNNPRIVKDDKFKKLVKSIKEFPKMMELRPMVIDSEGIVLGGNMRLKALKELGYKDIPKEWVKFAKDLTEEEKKRFIIADNVGFGLWDWEQLANEWNEEELIDWGLDIPDFEEEDLEAVEDNYSEPEQMQVDVVEGDLIEFVCQDGRVHRLLCGDSTCSDSVGKLMDGKKADIVFTDPPYNFASDSSNFASDVSKAMNDLKNSDWDKDFNIEVPIINAIEATKKDAVFYVWTSHFLIQRIWDVLNDYCTFTSYLVWSKPNPMPSLSKRHPTWNTELCAYGVRGTKRTVNFPNEGHFLSCRTVTKKSDGTHPTQKPIELISPILQFSSKVKQLILDLFLGSGSTLVAAHQLKRTCYGCELDAKYCQVIIDRMTKLDETLTVKINGKEYKKEGAEVPF